MKKYLFGLGTMLVGAGLMFVLMHGEVSADNKEVPEQFVCSSMTTFFYKDESDGDDGFPLPADILNCKTKNLDCGFTPNGSVSCVKRGIF